MSEPSRQLIFDPSRRDQSLASTFRDLLHNVLRAEQWIEELRAYLSQCPESDVDGYNRLAYEINACREIYQSRVAHTPSVGDLYDCLVRIGEPKLTYPALVKIRDLLIDGDLFDFTIDDLSIPEIVRRLRDRAEIANGKPPKEQTKPRRSRRGHRPGIDEKEDRRIYDAWNSGRYEGYKDLAQSLELPFVEIKRALDRERHRRLRTGQGPGW
jgi:hypothetical protein